jgi:hypothetical protein
MPAKEIGGLSQIAKSSKPKFSRRVTVVSEQSVAILSSVLRSNKSAQRTLENGPALSMPGFQS